MVTISLRIEETLRDELEETAKTRGTSVSDIIRQAIEIRLGHGVARDSLAPHSMSKADRHRLVLLHEILKRLDPDECDYHEGRIEVLNRGFTGEYGAEFVGVEAELSLSDCKLVWDILDMFSVIQSSVMKISIDNLNAFGEHTEADLKFSGFDANDELEGSMLAYAQYLVAHDRWTSLASCFGDEYDRGNSHMPRLPVYRRMLEIYRPIWQQILTGHGRGADRYILSESELMEIIKATRYPR